MTAFSSFGGGCRVYIKLVALRDHQVSEWAFRVRHTGRLTQAYHGAKLTFSVYKTGLLPLLKSIQKPTELKKFAGETFAVDAYGWLHRGCIGCAVELAQGKPTRKSVPSVAPLFSQSLTLCADMWTLPCTGCAWSSTLA